MKSRIIPSSEIAQPIADELLSRMNRYTGKPIFHKRYLAIFGYEIYGIRKDKTEDVVFRVKLSGPAKFRQIKMEWEPKLLTI